MEMTLTEKILARASGLASVKAGDIVQVKVDLVFASDVTMPISVNELELMASGKVFDQNKIAVVCDHFVPNATLQAAELVKQMREFASKQKLSHYYEAGRGRNFGIEHVLLPEEGLVRPGMVIMGGDSHTTSLGALAAFASGFGSTDIAAAMALGETWLRVPETMVFEYYGEMQPWVSAKDLILYTIGQITVSGALYRTMEFSGPIIHDLSVDQRLTMCNMAVEAGAKNAIVAPDKTTVAYLEDRGFSDINTADYETLYSDPGASYYSVMKINVSNIEPQIACPSSPDNVKVLRDVAGQPIDAAFIGSCTNGRIEDLRVAAEILKDRQVSADLRLIVIPATNQVYLQALAEGLIDIFAHSGAVVSTPTCGPCFGGHMGLLAAGERIISTSNRNFIGRMGHPESEVFLASPAVTAASAIVGRIVHPVELLSTEKK